MNVQRMSQRTDLHSNACGCTVIVVMLCHMCNSAKCFVYVCVHVCMCCAQELY